MKTSTLSEISILDIQDRVIKNRQALGFLADHVKDQQLSGNLMLIEESMEVVEQMLDYIKEKGIEEERAIHQEAPFD